MFVVTILCPATYEIDCTKQIFVGYFIWKLVVVLMGDTQITQLELQTVAEHKHWKAPD